MNFCIFLIISSKKEKLKIKNRVIEVCDCGGNLHHHDIYQWNLLISLSGEQAIAKKKTFKKFT